MHVRDERLKPMVRMLSVQVHCEKSLKTHPRNLGFLAALQYIFMKKKNFMNPGAGVNPAC